MKYMAFLCAVLGGAECDLPADAAGGAGDNDHAAREEGGAAHDRGRARRVKLALWEHDEVNVAFRH